MGLNTEIGWTHHSISMWHGCVEVQKFDGCQNCYARVLDNRYYKDSPHWGLNQPRLEIKSAFKNLELAQKKALAANEIHRVFIGSMMDIFEKPMPLIDSKGNAIDGKDTGWLRSLLFQHISNNIYPNLMFLLLTKRPSNINKYIPESWKKNPPSNVIFGTSPVNQETADKLIPQLMEVNGKRFLSVEPQLGEINLEKYLWHKPTFHKDSGYCKDCGDPAKTACDNTICQFKPIAWVINGGDSGHHKRPFNLDWAYSMKKQCEDARVPFFFKQIDKVKEIPSNLMVRQFPSNENQLIAKI